MFRYSRNNRIVQDITVFLTALVFFFIFKKKYTCKTDPVRYNSQLPEYISFMITDA